MWIPKFRKPVLAGGVAAVLRRVLEQAAWENDWLLHELNVQPDHVHALVQVDPGTSVARAMQILKGGSSFRLRREFPELKKILWGGSLRADGYFAESVGAVQEEAIRRYIREQPEKDQSRI